ncbi:hypothetical protein CC80DRAFT_420573, partial [Byssothecium circinans]
ELVQYIGRLTDRGLLPIKEMIRNFGLQIAKKELRVHWANHFIQRHAKEALGAIATRMDRVRHQADLGIKYEQFFQLLLEKIKEYDIEPRHTYNMDEKGFLIGVIRRSKRIFIKAM